MRLCVKIKQEIVASCGKKDDVNIQTIGPNFIYLKMAGAQAFSDEDVKYLIDSIPEYEQLCRDIKNYVETLEGNKTSVLTKLKEKTKKLKDATPLDTKFKVKTKIKHCVEYDCAVTESDYSTIIDQYDKVADNILYKD